MAGNIQPSEKSSSGLIILKKIVEGTSDQTGEQFFRILVKNLAESLNAHGVWVTEHLKQTNRLRALAFWLRDHYVDDYEYDIPGTPCEPVLDSHTICHVAEDVIELYPNDPDLPPLDAVSYMGLALRDENDVVLGHLALLDNKPMAELPEAFAIFRIFAARAAAELRRMQYERRLIENEAKLNRMINGTMESLVECDDNFIITQFNKAASYNFQTRGGTLAGINIKELFNAQDYERVVATAIRLKVQVDGNASTIIKGNLNCITQEGNLFPAEVAVSQYEYQKKIYFALFIRNLSEHEKAREEIKQLNAEAVFLREQVNQHYFNHIIGESPQILKALEAIRQVAPTNSTVMIRGETGTGKELFALAIHKASRRNQKPMVALNCAALPSDLVESELFGHVKGAFTGAASARDGRFLLADGGTIFLDEIGELPLPLQAKLLRVLQEGEFEPVGSSGTIKVDVRVVAATNRNLEEEIERGRFRSDLYYRLNVFPVEIPPLRDRGNDIILLAEAFLDKYARRSAIPPVKLNEADRQQLLAYHWPGNVRELQNLMERCIIASQGKSFSFREILPSSGPPVKIDDVSEQRVYTNAEMAEFEKQNIIRAMQLTNWKISGADGAAALLQVPVSTLSSRIVKLKIKQHAS